MKYKVYDKVAWQLDGGQEEDLVISHFKFIMKWCHDVGILSKDGEELYELGVDDSCSLHERMFTEKGKMFMEKFYNSIANTIEGDQEKLNTLYSTIEK